MSDVYSDTYWTEEFDITEADLERIARHMQPVFDWDWEARLELFPCIREEVLPDLERLLERLKLPLRIAKEEYARYRDRLWQVAKELIQGFQDFRPEQDEAMQAILAGQDTPVVLPTGSGKSLTLQLPALLRDGVTLVFPPLIALMRDQVDRLKGAGLTLVDYIVSGQSGAHRDAVYRRMARGERRFILEHFGEALEAPPFPCCDLCHPDMSLPWRDVPAEEVSDFPAQVDPAYIALRAVEWNETLRQDRYRQPYTEKTLARILCGNAYAAAQHEADPVRRLRRIKRLEASPYYSVLQGLRGGENAVLRILARLRREGYTRLEEITFASADDGPVTYHAPVLEEKGRRQIQSGRYVGLQQ